MNVSFRAQMYMDRARTGVRRPLELEPNDAAKAAIVYRELVLRVTSPECLRGVVEALFMLQDDPSELQRLLALIDREPEVVEAIATIRRSVQHGFP